MSIKKITPALIYKLVLKHNNKISSGCSCTFIPVNAKLGLKLYIDGYNRNSSYARQRRAAKLNLAPKCYEKFGLKLPIIGWDCDEMPVDSPVKVYGFVTQIANTSKRAYPYQVDSLWDKLSKNGFSINDIDVGHNVGWIGNKLVCIDFDKYSMLGY